MKNFTEIVNIAGQRHNAKMFETDTDRQSGAARQADDNAANAILKELGLDTSELLQKIGAIESCCCDLQDGSITPIDETKKINEIDRLCGDLRYMITNVIGE